MTTIAYQLYCSRNWPLSETLAMISRTGFKAVEAYGGLLADVDALRAELEANELTMPSTHMGLDDIEKDPRGAITRAKALGVTKVFAPHIGPGDRAQDVAGWEAFGARLLRAGQPLMDAGLTFGWHNHDFELADLGGGTTGLDAIFAASPDMQHELDLGWVSLSGHDPIGWIKKYASQISAVHIKDIAPAGTAQDEDGWADAGHGTLDWAAIGAALREAGIDHFVAEHDNPSDHARFARRSLDTIRRL